MVKHIVNGIRGNEETLVVDVISKARPLSQSITEKYTFNHMKPRAQTMYEKALAKARDILKNSNRRHCLMKYALN